MNTLSGVIRAIECEVATEYLPGAIAWCDEHCEGAWSDAIARFDEALSVAQQRESITYALQEGEQYKNTILGLLKRYKAAQAAPARDEVGDFLASLRVK